MKFCKISLNRQFLFLCFCVCVGVQVCVRMCVRACAFTHECMSHMPILESRNIPFGPSIFQPELFCPNRETLIYSTFALHQVHRRRCLKSPSLILTTTRQSCIQVVDKKGTVLAGELQDLLDVSDPPAWHPESVAFAPSITLTGTQPTVGSQCIIDSQRYLWFGA